MPYMETPNELAEELADLLGVYGAGPEIDEERRSHPDDCKCRMCFVTGMADRIRECVRNEELLNRQNEQWAFSR